MAIQDLVERARAYAIPAEIVDGNDVLAVYEATRRALEHARSGQGPYFLECKTMRMRGHAEHDDMRYVPKALLDEWESKDAIARYRARLIDMSMATDTELTHCARQVRPCRRGVVRSLGG